MVVSGRHAPTGPSVLSPWLGLGRRIIVAISDWAMKSSMSISEIWVTCAEIAVLGVSTNLNTVSLILLGLHSFVYSLGVTRPFPYLITCTMGKWWKQYQQ